VIEAGPVSMPVYFCNGVGPSIKGQRWTVEISKAHFWTSESGARAAFEEWDLDSENARVAQHTINLS
jgi:hypothetical protein